MNFPTAGGDFEPAPAGSHSAVCTRVIDLGTQPGTWGGKPIDPKRKLRIFWEIAAKMKDGQPFLVMKSYNASMHKKASLRADVQSWFGVKMTDEQAPNFDPQKLLGKTCLLSLVSSTDGNYTNVDSILKLPQGVLPMKPVGKLQYFDLDKFDPQVFISLSEKTQATIAQSPEYRALHAEGGSQEGMPEGVATNPDDLIPF